MNTLEQAREYFSKDIFATEATGIVITDVKERYARCELKIEPKHLNAGNQVMGGAIYTLADLTFAVAANSMGVHTVTASSNISFLTTCKGDILIAEANVIRDGRTSCVYEVRVKDNLGTLVAFVTVSGAHVG